jgi:UPF0716 protein FxsA
MSLRFRLLVFGYPLAELVTAWLVAVWIGWGWTILLLLVGILLGLTLIRRLGGAALREARASVAGSRPMDPGPAVGLLGALLVAVPGFLTDVAGLLLVFPPTRRLAVVVGGSWLATRAFALRMPGMRTPGDVIQGTVIPADEPPGDRPALGA